MEEFDTFDDSSPHMKSSLFDIIVIVSFVICCILVKRELDRQGIEINLPDSRGNNERGVLDYDKDQQRLGLQYGYGRGN